MKRRIGRTASGVLLLCVLLTLLIMGCAEAASTDWVGAKPEYYDELTLAEGAPEEKASDIYVEPEPVVHEEPEEPEVVEEPVEEPEVVEEEPSEEPVEEPIEEPEEEPLDSELLHGTIEDGLYTLSCTIQNGVMVDILGIPESYLVNQQATGTVPAEEKGGDLDKARMNYLIAYNDGDKASAKEDFEFDFTDIDAPKKTQISEIMKYNVEMGIFITQFDITDYDFSKPASCDEDYIECDAYSSKGNKLIFSFDYDEGILSQIQVDYE